MTNAEQALELIADGMTVGLGSGAASTHFICILGRHVQGGLKVRGVPTSNNSAELAKKLGIPLTTLEDCATLDITVDGADEVDPNLDLIKGYGHALVREKIVAAASRKLVILIGPENVEAKLVPVLGSRGKLPVEVVPFAMPLCRRRIQEMGHASDVLKDGGKPFVTDNGNYILECRVGPIADPAALEASLRSVPGVVGTGLFLGMADMVIVQREENFEVRRRKSGTGA